MRPISEDAQDALDEALEILSSAGPDYPPFGFVNHGPMAAEALTRLDRADAVVPWTLKYRERLEAAPPLGTAVDPDDWPGRLGDAAHFADWEARFEADLGDAPWATVVETWVPRLAPGAAADALHGVIRTAHAVRMLEARVTPLRITELARGLALWASTYQDLPGDPTPGSSPEALSPAEAINQVRRITDKERGDAFSIVDGLAALRSVPDFRSVIGLVDPTGDPEGFVEEVAVTFATVTLEQVREGLTAVIFTHTVTGPAALGVLLPYVAPEHRAAAAAYGWQAAAGVYAAFAAEPTARAGEYVPDVDDLVDQAIATGDEHAIKLTETCVRLDGGSGLHLAAAGVAVTALAG